MMLRRSAAIFAWALIALGQFLLTPSIAQERFRVSFGGFNAYKVLRKMTTLDMAPNVTAFKSVQRIVARINPRIAQVDLDQVIDASFVRNLESSGFLSELRKRIR